MAAEAEADATKATHRSRPGELLQFTDEPGGSITDVVVGFDFGTSSAKVAIQTPYKVGGRTVFAQFGDLAHPASRYLLPTVLYADHKGRLSLRRPEGWKETRRHLKLELLADRVLEASPSGERNEDLARAAAFVGLVLREARRFLLETEQQNYGSDRLRWSMNLGIPSRGYDDSAIRDRFALLARAAWLLSLAPVAPTLSEAMEAVFYAGTGLGLGATIDVVPEVVAATIGYTQSRQRRPGLHLILDVGASTLDLCAFSLHERQDGNVFSLLTTNVQHLGLLPLYKRRMDACGLPRPLEKDLDLVRSLPEEAPESPQMARRLRECDAAFVDECARGVLFRTLHDLHERRDPHSPAWREGLPLFVTGGGSQSPIVDEVVRCADQIASSGWDPYKGLERRDLPLPPGALPVSVSPTESLRLAVAFGLSFPNQDIGVIEPPGETADIDKTGQPRAWRAAYVDKDLV